MPWFLFILLAVFTLGGGLAVVVSRNVVHAALALLVSLVAVAGIYLLLFAEFLALVQVLIYGGAIIIVLILRHHAHAKRRVSPHLRQQAVALGRHRFLGPAGSVGARVHNQRG